MAALYFKNPSKNICQNFFLILLLNVVWTQTIAGMWSSERTGGGDEGTHIGQGPQS